MKFFLVLLLTFTPLLAESPEWKHQTFQHEETALPYASLRQGPADQKLPLVLFLHGAGERGTDNQAQLKHGMQELLAWSQKADQPCHILAPQCPNGIWWAQVENYRSPEELKFNESQPMLDALLALIEATAKEHQIDTKRIYLTGLSMGGYGTFALLAKSPDTWAAALPICGGGEAATVERFQDVPIHIVHGEDDSVVPVALSRHLYQALQKVKAPEAHYTEHLLTDHDSWTMTYRNPQFWEWMFAQKK
ncbi:prolyl oligopeptidase family serine peptidase [Roseibacillus persicicus]|uniref:carboxylesterase family protein n=1 Tax=Roseibacillus persicicus TaxID=454148 RepID=UPI00398A96F2